MLLPGIQKCLSAIGLLTLGAVMAFAQVGPVKELSRTDAAVSLYGAFNGTTTANGVAQSPSNAAGGLIEVRHIVNPIVGFEGTYSFNRANQTYSSTSYAVCGVCNAQTSSTAVSANAHEVSGDWVASLKLGNFRPFALAGGGILFVVPSGQAFTTTVITVCGVEPDCTPGSSASNTIAASSTKAVFVYGAGIDWRLVPHMGLRFQYRGNLYKAPDLTALYTSTGSFTHTAEPMLGAYLRF